MPIADVADWINEFGRPGFIWFAKRLAANDTHATGGHQAGPYIPKDFLLPLFPALNRKEVANPDVWFDLYVDSHADHRLIRAVWYNNRVTGSGTRNETRLTGFGGRQSALLDPESTGALAVFAFPLDASGAATECHVWVCEHATEEDAFEERLGPVEPKSLVIWRPGAAPQPDLFTDESTARTDCHLEPGEIPSVWLERFPTGTEIIQKTLELRPPGGTSPDLRMLRRRSCEYEVFRSVERVFWLPRIREGFSTLEDFLTVAQTILQSRKSRSGNSLELHAREIMTEEGLRPGKDFVYRPVIENGKRPDFIFPSVDAYVDQTFPEARLRMLAAKTTCRDRWRQILNEADRIRVKHLLTLQEGVSEGQFREMQDAQVQLVVPSGLHNSYPSAVRPHLVSLESFIGEIRLLTLQQT